MQKQRFQLNSQGDTHLAPDSAQTCFFSCLGLPAHYHSLLSIYVVTCKDLISTDSITLHPRPLCQRSSLHPLGKNPLGWDRYGLSCFSLKVKMLQLRLGA